MKIQKWIKSLFDVVHKNWQHHSPSKHINFKAEFSNETECWHIYAAPVLQEVFGGPDDGKQVWPGFIFDFGEFSRSEGVSVIEQAFMSVCSQCNEHPKNVVKGRFDGHNFYLHIYLEPSSDSDVVEIVDVTKEKTYLKVNSNEEQQDVSQKSSRKLWKATADFSFSAENLAALFVSQTKHWYEDSKNSLYGKKDKAYNAILGFLNGNKPSELDFEMQYVLSKFEKEWIDPTSGMFEVQTS